MSELFPDADPDQMRQVFQSTRIARSPLTGFVAGYHTLPFTLIGPNDEPGIDAIAASGSLKLTGQITVSPKLVMTLNPNDERFAEIFPEETPFMDRRIVGRVFGFNAAYRRNHRIRGEHLQVEEISLPDQELLEKVLDEMSRGEVINMGVIWCPAPRFYPISLERFIVSVLDRELK
jgi:hypothetical protein